jgi:hypothetical protein
MFFEMFYGWSMAFCPDFGLSENRKEKVKGLFTILNLWVIFKEGDSTLTSTYITLSSS